MGGPIEDWLTSQLMRLANRYPVLAPLRVKSEREVGSAHFFSSLAIQLCIAVLMGVFHALASGFVMVILPEIQNGRRIDRITRGAGWVVGLLPIIAVLCV
jgi:vacuolar-type H+-ATPase subunit I/STV1